MHIFALKDSENKTLLPDCEIIKPWKQNANLEYANLYV